MTIEEYREEKVSVPRYVKEHYDVVNLLIRALLEIKAGGENPRRIATKGIYDWDVARNPKPKRMEQ